MYCISISQGRYRTVYSIHLLLLSCLRKYALTLRNVTISHTLFFNFFKLLLLCSKAECYIYYGLIKRENNSSNSGDNEHSKQQQQQQCQNYVERMITTFDTLQTGLLIFLFLVIFFANNNNIIEDKTRQLCDNYSNSSNENTQTCF